MPNTHLTSSRAVHEDVNNMVAYNDFVLRTQRKKVFAIVCIPCFIIALLVAVAFGLRDILLPMIGIGSSNTAAISDADDENIEIFLAANKTDIDYRDDAYDNDFGITSLSISVSDTVYNQKAKSWEITNIPLDAKVTDYKIIDVNATMEKNELESLTITELRAYLSESEPAIDIEYAKNNEMVNAGDYLIIAVIDDDDTPTVVGGEKDNYCAAQLYARNYITIEKANLDYITTNSVANVTKTVYNRKVQLDNIKIVGLPNDKTIDVSYFAYDNSGKEANPKDVGTYSIEKIVITSKNYETKVLEFTYKDVSLVIEPYCIDEFVLFDKVISKKYDGETLYLDINFENDPSGIFKKTDINKDKDIKYYVNGHQISKEEASAKNVADSKIVTFDIEMDNYCLSKDFKCRTEIIIEKADFIGIVRPQKTFSFRQIGKVFYPEYARTEDYSKNHEDPKENNTRLVYLDKNGDGVYETLVDEISKIGDYRVVYTFSHPNYNNFILNIDYSIKFNPFIIILGIILGFLLTELVVLIIMRNRKRKDARSRQHFIALRTQLERERNGIVCESYARSKDKFSKKKGRLYLTAKALEFYDRNYVNNYQNSIITAKDIIDIKSRGLWGGKLIILSRGGVQKFKVPAGTAKLWKKELLHYKYMEQCYYSEVHAINANRGPKTQGKKC